MKDSRCVETLGWRKGSRGFSKLEDGRQQADCHSAFLIASWLVTSVQSLVLRHSQIYNSAAHTVVRAVTDPASILPVPPCSPQVFSLFRHVTLSLSTASSGGVNKFKIEFICATMHDGHWDLACAPMHQRLVLLVAESIRRGFMEGNWSENCFL